MKDTELQSSPAKTVVAPIVGIGASAGGLEALQQLLAAVPADTGMAYVVIQHLDPEHRSMLAGLLASRAQIPVVEVVDGMEAAPNRIHVIPPGAELHVRDGVLSLESRSRTRGLHLPIDTFLRALAADQPGRGIGVVLSGSGSDGTDGLRAIKAAGGITLAQAPDSALFRGMPASAIAAGVVDVEASPAELGRELARLSHHPYLMLRDESEGETDELGLVDDMGELTAAAIAEVRRHAGLDFRGYKRPTIRRRLARRMALRRIGSTKAYVESLRDDPREAIALGRDILVHVTAFFRDPAAFAALEHEVFPAIVRRKADDEVIRMWIAGCSTGEEAYSLAIALCECLDREDRRLQVKLFATDLSEHAIEVARSGLYGEAELRGVSPERLERFFERVDGQHRICKRVRDMCVFVVHDLARQPPFARIDLVSCRNLLIYFDTELQRRVLPMLHNALNQPGYLLLGGSESIGGFTDLFVPLDKEHRIFLKTGEGRRLSYPLAFGRAAEPKDPASAAPPTWQPQRDAQRQAERWLSAHYAPPGVLIDERLQVVQYHGRTGDFLEPPPGEPQTSVLRMARHGLAAHLHEAIEAAKAQPGVVRRPGLRLGDGAEGRTVDLEVVPLAEAPDDARYFLLVFVERPAPGAHEGERPAERSARAPGDQPHQGAARLAAELAVTQDYVRDLLGKHHEITQELAATNEEMVSANEELQSINEELESAKEELQATNEELTTVNDELRHRNRELDLVANDLVNVLESVEIPVIIVDDELRVRRFTPRVREVASLLPTDVGRPIDDVKLRIDVNDLTERIRGVIEANEPKEWEVQRQDGRWLRLQVRPYHTADGRLNGAVLSFVDVDGLKRALQDAEVARDVSRGIVETVPIALVVLDTGLRVVSTNPAFLHGLGGDAAAVEGVGLFELGDGAWDMPALREALASSAATGSRFRELELRRAHPGTSEQVLLVSGSPLRSGEGGVMLLAIEDVTARRELEARERGARLEAEQSNLAKDLFLATLSHELRTPLGTILMAAQLLQAVQTEDPRITRASAAIQRAVGNQARLIDDLLDISRIVSGKLMLDFQAVDLAAVAQAAVDVARGSADAKGLTLTLVANGGPLGTIRGDPTRLQQVVANLIGNAIKFTPSGGTITVELEPLDGRAQLVVRDTGCGVSAAAIPRLFDRFVQAESSSTRVHGGLGLGLAIVRYLVEVHGGQVRAESPGEGQGAVFRVILPCASELGVLPAAAIPPPPAGIVGVRVLMVEDDEGTRDTFAMMLGQLGADVRVAASVATGLVLVEQFRPQVILSDIAMPGEDGYAFIQRLRALGRERGGATPTAALTALASEEDRKRALEAGFQMHLAKPIDAGRLAAAVGMLARWPQ